MAVSNDIPRCVKNFKKYFLILLYMTNLIGFRLDAYGWGSLQETHAILSKKGKVLITREDTPYSHYHGMIYANMSVIQFKKWLYNQKYKLKKTLKYPKLATVYKKIWVDSVSNDELYKEYILKHPNGICSASDLEYFDSLGKYYWKHESVDIHNDPCP